MEHAHSHTHDESNHYLEQLCTIGFCGALGAVGVLMFWKGKLSLILAVNSLDWPVLLAGLSLLAMVLVQAASLWIAVGRTRRVSEAEEADPESAGHTHTHEQAITSGPPSPAPVTAQHHHSHDHDHEHHHHDHDHAHGHDCAHDHAHAHSHTHESIPLPVLKSSHDHGHDHGFAPWRYAVLLLPIVLYCLGLPNKGLTANLNADSGGLEYPGAVSAVVFTHDGKRALSASEDQTVKVWDVNTGKDINTLIDGNAGPVFAIALSQDDRWALSASEDPSLTLWDVKEHKKVRDLKGHEGPAFAVAFARDGQRALSGGKDGTVRLWDVRSGEALHVLKGHDGAVTAVALASDGKFALSGGKDRTVRLWDVESGHEVRTLATQRGPIYALAFSPDGKLALAGGYDSNRQIPEPPRPLQGVPKGTLTLWEVATGQQVRSLDGCEGPIYGVAFSPDGKQILSGGYDGILRLWNVADGREVRSWQEATPNDKLGYLKPLTSVSFSPDGLLALAGSYDKMVHLYRIDSEAGMRSLAGHGKPPALAGDHGPPVPLAFKELDEAAYTRQTRKYWEGKYGVLKGQFAPMAGNKRFKLVRFKINCCAADAIPINVEIIAPEPIVGIKPLDWVSVTGLIQFHKPLDREEYKPVMILPSLKDIQRVEADANPYIQ